MNERPGEKNRSTKIVNRKFLGVSRWEIQLYVNNDLLCRFWRKTRDEARKVAKRYMDTGMIPLF